MIGFTHKLFHPKYSLTVRNRLREKISIFPEFTILLTGHKKLRTYLHRFGITDNPMCPREKEEQTSDYLIKYINARD
jgi:hypothetical protein